MRINWTLLLAGAVFVALLAGSWQARKGGRMGVYMPDATFPGVHWTPPARYFVNIGCCTDDIRSAEWDGAAFSLNTEDAPIPVGIYQRTGGKEWGVPGASDVLGARVACGKVWLPETKHDRLLEVGPDGAYKTDVGSNAAGPVMGITVLPSQPLSLMLATSAKPGAKAGELLQYSPGGEAIPLHIGEDLTSPTGIAASSDGHTLYIADERPDELAWIRVQNVNGNWVSRGKLARFRLNGNEPRNMIRGIAVIRYQGADLILGSAPPGVVFYSSDGHRLGAISTNEPISRLLVGTRKRTLSVFAVGGRTIWGARMRDASPVPEPVCDAVNSSP